MQDFLWTEGDAQFTLPSFQYCCLQRARVLGMECSYIFLCSYTTRGFAWHCCLKMRKTCRLLRSATSLTTIPYSWPFTGRGVLFTYLPQTREERATTDLCLIPQNALSIQICGCIDLPLTLSFSWLILNCLQMNNPKIYLPLKWKCFNQSGSYATSTSLTVCYQC